jgi:hypothetical protein
MFSPSISTEVVFGMVFPFVVERRASPGAGFIGDPVNAVVMKSFAVIVFRTQVSVNLTVWQNNLLDLFPLHLNRFVSGINAFEDTLTLYGMVEVALVLTS